jgi:aldehyde:ferredoxin oxidoreductase
VKKAAEKIGKGAEKYAVHVGGQEPGMHDPRLPRGNGYPMSAARYQMDATPGRHMLSFGSFVIFRHCVNMTGMCFQGGWSGSKERLLGFPECRYRLGHDHGPDAAGRRKDGQHPACL